MRKILHPDMRPALYGIFITLGAFVTLLVNLTSPSDPKNAILFGYSLERLILSGGLLTLTLALLFLTWKLLHHPNLSPRVWAFLTTRDVVFFASLVAFILFASVLFFPAYRLGTAASYVTRLYPIWVWLAVSSGGAAAMILHGRKKLPLREILHLNRTAILTGGILLGAFLLLWLVIAWTGIGVRDHEDYWYGAGVPVLALQILISVVTGAIFLHIKPNWDWKLETLFCLALWGVTAWLWMREPLATNYFFPDTAGNEIYPYSDSATFDVGSQFALIGQGMFNGAYFDRPLYTAFLTYLHMALGQDVNLLMNAQAALFAIFSVIIYLIGRELHSRAFGASAAVLLALRGVNAIYAGKWIDTASPKMMLTDFPAAIGVALFLLFALLWVKNPARRGFAIWAGGILGLTVMLRTNAFMLLPVVILVAFIFIKPRWNRAAVGSALMILAMLTATLPWDIRNRDNGIPFFYVYYSRIELILRYRYGIGADAYIPPPTTSNIPVRARIEPRPSPELDSTVCNSTPCSIVNHFTHNVITSVLSLPTTFLFDDLWNTIKLGKPFFWRPDWSGEGITPGTAAFFLAHIALIALGVGALWERNKTAAALAVLTFTAYHLTNALGLTSGGRYIVPVDWMVSLFLMAGWLQLTIWFFRLAGTQPASDAPVADQPHAISATPVTPILANLALVFMLGALVPLSELPFERRYEQRTSAEMLTLLERQGLLEQAGLEKEALTEFLDAGKGRILEGRIMYPRHYPAGGGQYDLSTYYMERDYSRLVFTLIGPVYTAGQGFILPGDKPLVPLHTADVIAIGCLNTAHYAPFTDALAIFVLGDEPYVQLRSPQVPLQCPFEEP